MRRETRDELLLGFLAINAMDGLPSTAIGNDGLRPPMLSSFDRVEGDLAL